MARLGTGIRSLNGAAAWELLALGAVVLQYHRALSWIAGTWGEQTYQSWGFLALALLVPVILKLPPRRATPSVRHLVAVLLLVVVNLICAPLSFHMLGAILGVLSLHLTLVAFRRYRRCWLLLPQLWLALACLPAVFWANAMFGYHLQHLASRLAAAGLALYGVPVSASGTLLQLPSGTVAVDATCSGLKLLYAGVLFGLVSTPAGCGVRRKILYWICLLTLLLGANVVRIISLVVGQLHLGQPVGETMHHGIGLVAFALVCVACLLLGPKLAPCHERCSAGAEATP